MGYTVEVVAKNASLKNSFKTFQYNKIQVHYDFELKLGFIQGDLLGEKIIPLDTKIIINPENNGSLLNGNLMFTVDYNILLHMNRLKGALSNIKDLNPAIIDPWIKKIDSLTSNYKKELIKKNNNSVILNNILKDFKTYNYQILCNPQITNIFPSLFIQVPENTMFIPDSVQISEIEEFLLTPSIIQQFFPAMGTENSQYHLLLENVIRKMPAGLRDELFNNFNVFNDFIKTNTILP